MIILYSDTEQRPKDETISATLCTVNTITIMPTNILQGLPNDLTAIFILSTNQARTHHY